MASLLLSRKLRKKIREISRRRYIVGRKNGKTAHAIIQEAQEDVRQEMGMGIVVSILLGVAINLVVELITKWILENYTSDPPEEYQPGEPGYGGFY